jgi:hypothetical protein
LSRNERFFGQRRQSSWTGSPPLVTFVRILAITDSEQQESKLALTRILGSALRCQSSLKVFGINSGLNSLTLR